jgi:predicted transcriptional regulator
LHAIISLKPRHVSNILKGNKTVELRTRNVTLSIGATLWIYSTLPVGRLEALATVRDVIRCAPRVAWRLHKAHLGLTYKEFAEYINEAELVTLIVLGGIRALEPKLDLSALRRLKRRFQPPQFFAYLLPGTAIAEALTREYIGALKSSA